MSYLHKWIVNECRDHYHLIKDNSGDKSYGDYYSVETKTKYIDCVFTSIYSWDTKRSFATQLEIELYGLDCE